MKAAEITDKLNATLKSGEYQFLQGNFPNGGMIRKNEIKHGYFGLANVASTIAKLLDIEIPSMWEESILYCLMHII